MRFSRGDFIDLGSRIEELCGKGAEYRGLYARTQYHGWWRIHRFGRFTIAYRVRRLKR